MSTKRPHSAAVGVRHTRMAGISASTVPPTVNQKTMTTVGSVADSFFMMMAVPPASLAPSTATRAAGSKAMAAPGLSMTRMPMNPTTVALARRQRTTSPSTMTARMVVNSGRENKMAVASASGKWVKA